MVDHVSILQIGCPINKKYNKCFQYTVTVALNHEEIGKSPGRITKIKPF